jgi:hypothetical protein
MSDADGESDHNMQSVEEGDDPEDAEREEAFETLRSFCRRLEEAGAERVVLRWIDEKRPVKTEEGGMSIESVQQLTVKGAIGDEVTSCTVEHVPKQVAEGLLRRFDFEIIERNDNLT